jgi:hypothetical protein
MRTPDLTRLVETFIRIGRPDETTPDNHFRLLRNVVAPLVKDLRKRELIGWFSFLVHDHSSGVPTTPQDDAIYFHLRLERLPKVEFDCISRALPLRCVFTRPVGLVDERSLHPAILSALVAPELATGWALFGASSEWALDLASAHKDDQSLPIDNVAQFLHYLGNQLLIRRTTIPMP